MRVIVYSSKPYDQEFLVAANSAGRHDLVFLEASLDLQTLELARGAACVCVFVGDTLDAIVLQGLAALGVKLIALRCAGFNHVDLAAAARFQLQVARVPAYSPYAVAEHATALLLTLNRKTHKAYNRVREGNFSLSGLSGFDLHGRTVGIVGMGKIGAAFARIMSGFGCEVLAYDTQTPSTADPSNVKYVPFDTLCEKADIISLHCPLNKSTHHLIDQRAFGLMKPGVFLINTGRGGLVDTRAAIVALKSGKLGALGLDVYEEEEGVFFEDHSGEVIQDDVLMRLMTFPNVLVTSHQAFLTHEALTGIAKTTMANLDAFEAGHPMPGLLPA
jgi:D-lactate dehydrogenase